MGGTGGGGLRGERKIDGFRKKMMLPESEIPECPEHEVKSKIWNIFVSAKILEEYSVKILKTDPYFCEHYKKKKQKKKQIDKNRCEYILLYYLELMFALLNIF